MGNPEFDVVVGAESRGFLFGMPLAYNKSKGFVPVRKKGKLPRETVSREYALEYGTAEIEIHKEDIRPGQRVVFVDDLLATGGTAKAAIDLIEQVQTLYSYYMQEAYQIRIHEILLRQQHQIPFPQDSASIHVH